MIEETIDELEESKAGDHGYEDDEEKDDEDDKKDKGFLTDSERDLLRYILQSQGAFMPDQKQDRAMVVEAKKILSDIVSHQKNNTDRLSQFDKQVDELKRAQRLLEESVYRGGTETLNDDSALKSFIRKDGSIQWTTEKVYVDTDIHLTHTGGNIRFYGNYQKYLDYANKK